LELLMSVRILEIPEATHPISSAIPNAYIDFSKMTCSLGAVVTDAISDGRRVVGDGFYSNGRYGQGGLVRERFAPRVLEAGPASLLDEGGSNLDPGPDLGHSQGDSGEGVGRGRVGRASGQQP
jgi:D(-)-tartrate dehydratase